MADLHGLAILTWVVGYPTIIWKQFFIDGCSCRLVSLNLCWNLEDDGLGKTSPTRSKVSIRKDFVQKLASIVLSASTRVWLLWLLLPEHFADSRLVMEEPKEDGNKEVGLSMMATMVDVNLEVRKHFLSIGICSV